LKHLASTIGAFFFLISTIGVGGVADGNPYIQRWADDNGNIVTRAISRPHVVSNYFERRPRVDNHNQSQQHELAMEDAWLSQDCWFRRLPWPVFALPTVGN
jgi:hypothetical protein